MITYLFLYSLFFIFSFFYFYLRDLKIKSFKKNDLSKYSLSLSAFTLRDNSEHTSYVHSHLYTYNALARVFFFRFLFLFYFFKRIDLLRKHRYLPQTSTLSLNELKRLVSRGGCLLQHLSSLYCCK